MSPAVVAEVWPSAAARDQALWRRTREAPGGLLLVPPAFTLEQLLATLTRGLCPPHRPRPLAPLAGALLVQGLLEESEAAGRIYAGLAAGRRLPERLWRLLVEVKAAGLDHQAVAELARSQVSPGLAGLAELLQSYEAALDRLGLADQADQLAALEQLLARGERPAPARSWRGLVVHGVLWLRALDQRLLTALAGVMPVRVEMTLTPEAEMLPALSRLVEATARALEARVELNLELAWPGLGNGPLNPLALALLAPGRQVPPDSAAHLELARFPGRYAEAEAMVRRALELLEQGVAPTDLALVFPDLELYGPMVCDAAARLGLPLEHGQGEPLLGTPLVQAVLELLELPLEDYTREHLARVWSSPYLAPALARELELERPPYRAGELLARAGYVDWTHSPLEECLAVAARQGECSVEEAEELARACRKLRGMLEEIIQHDDLAGFFERTLSLAQRLGPPEPPPPAPHPVPLPPGPGPAARAVRDLAAWRQLAHGLAGLAGAARQVDDSRRLSLRRRLSLLRQALAGQGLGAGGRGGVRVLTLAEAAGLELHTVLVGGLVQGEFPRRPQGLHLLSARERRALGARAGRPVWRTEEEEYQGQVLRLAGLVAACRQGAWLSAPAGEMDGGALEPALAWWQAARALGREPAPPGGGVFGELAPLPEAREPLALWGGVSRALLRRGPAEHRELAQAALWHLVRRGEEARWQGVVGRVLGERARAELDLLPAGERFARAGPFSGRLSAPLALGLLHRVLSSPAARRLSPTALEQYAACPLSWFFSRLLRLEPLPEPGLDLERSQEGQWVHRTLALFFHPGEFDPDWDRAARRRRLEECLARAEAELAAGGQAGHPQARAARRRVLSRALAQVVEREWPLVSQAPPAGVEEELGVELPALAVPVADGPSLELVGRLDRRDLGAEVLRVTDYKHTTAAQTITRGVNPKEQAVSQFQVLVYLAAAREALGPGAAGLVLEGRLVSTLGEGFMSRTLRLVPDDPLLAPVPPEGGEEPNLFAAVAGLWGRILEGDFVARPEEGGCRYCVFGPLCRAHPAPGGGSGGES